MTVRVISNGHICRLAFTLLKPNERKLNVNFKRGNVIFSLYQIIVFRLCAQRRERPVGLWGKEKRQQVIFNTRVELGAKVKQGAKQLARRSLLPQGIDREVTLSTASPFNLTDYLLITNNKSTLIKMITKSLK